MSNTAHVSTSLGSEAGLAPLRAKSGWIVALGIVYVLAGLVALGSVVFATVVTVFIVGVMMLIAGVAEVINSFQIKTWGKFLVWGLLGLLYIVAGFFTFENRLLAALLRGKIDPVHTYRVEAEFGIPGGRFDVYATGTGPGSERWTLVAFLHYEYLDSSIADSPIVTDHEVVTGFAGFNFKVL